MTPAALLGALVILSSGAPASDPMFSRATLTADRLCFDSPMSVDWQALARQEFDLFPLEGPSLEQLAARANLTFDFSAELPASSTALHFYVLSEAGLREIAPKRLLGHVRYRHNAPEPPELETVYGEICLPRPDGLTDAGFVAATSVPAAWQTELADLRRSADGLLVRLNTGSSRLPPPGARGAVAVRTAYVLSAPELPRQYLFVRRVPDHDCLGVCCTYAYDLYRWEAGLPSILWSAYDCDV